MRDSTRRTFLASAAVAAVSAVASAQQAAPAPGKPITIIGLAFSHRKGKSTATALQACLDAAKAAGSGIQVEMIEVAGMNLHPEIAAGATLAPGQQDDFAPIAAKLADPKVAGIILASPVYFGSMSSLCKAFLERCTVFKKNYGLRNKVAGCISVAGNRNGGQELTIQGMHAALYSQDMIVVGDGKPTAHLGATLWNNQDGVAKDTLGLETAANLGRRVAEMAIKMSA